jgi:hypothetical protein
MGAISMGLIIGVISICLILLAIIMVAIKWVS